MTRTATGVAACLFVLLVAGLVPARAQDTAPAPADTSVQEPTFNLLHTSLAEQRRQREEEEASKPHYYPIMEPKALEMSLTLGFWDLGKPLLGGDMIIYKYTNENTYYGNVELVGESAFNPVLRLNYNFSSWFALEGVLGFSVSEYTASITNPHSLTNSLTGDDTATLEPVEELGEFDRENRSATTVTYGLNAVVYPFDYGNFGRGRWHPFVEAGIGRTKLSINSDYTDGSSTDWDLTLGGGVRLIADGMASVRFEVLYHRYSVQFPVGHAFQILNDGTLVVPVTRYVEGEGVVPVEDFPSHDINTLSWALGFTANF